VSSLLYTLMRFFEAAAFGRGSAFGVEPHRDDPQQRSQPALSVFPFFLPTTTALAKSPLFTKHFSLQSIPKSVCYMKMMEINAPRGC
ncbi:hypothetical protein, partial [Brevibacillus panacihumi]|uniref:hypothetical protein n=1 Tax=Brevibacillus panacihumi TaxID=497735 RepID=UPI003D1CC22A